MAYINIIKNIAYFIIIGSNIFWSQDSQNHKIILQNLKLVFNKYEKNNLVNEKQTFNIDHLLEEYINPILLKFKTYNIIIYNLQENHWENLHKSYMHYTLSINPWVTNDEFCNIKIFYESQTIGESYNEKPYININLPYNNLNQNKKTLPVKYMNSMALKKIFIYKQFKKWILSESIFNNIINFENSNEIIINHNINLLPMIESIKKRNLDEASKNFLKKYIVKYLNKLVYKGNIIINNQTFEVYEISVDSNKRNISLLIVNITNHSMSLLNKTTSDKNKVFYTLIPNFLIIPS